MKRIAAATLILLTGSGTYLRAQQGCVTGSLAEGELPWPVLPAKIAIVDAVGITMGEVQAHIGVWSEACSSLPEIVYGGSRSEHEAAGAEVWTVHKGPDAETGMITLDGRCGEADVGAGKIRLTTDSGR